MTDENDYDRVPIQRAGSATAVEDAPEAPDSRPDSRQYDRVPIQRAPVALKPSSEYDRVPIQRGPSDHNSAYPGSTIPENYGFTPSNMAGAAWDAAGNIVKSGYGAAKDLISSKAPVFVSDDKNGESLWHKYVTAPSEAEDEKARTAPSDLESVAHSVAGAIPFVGPLAAHIGERAGTGDIGGAVAEGSTYVLAPKAIEKAPALIKGGRNRDRNTTGHLGTRPSILLRAGVHYSTGAFLEPSEKHPSTVFLFYGLSPEFFLFLTLRISKHLLISI